MHQCIIKWIEDSMEVVHADSSFSIAMADPEVWHGLGLKCISGEAWESGALKMAISNWKQSKKSARRSHPEYSLGCKS